ncbi:L-threonylcarbamoyladenylate synthase [Variovorax sp. PCZ-1]|uniref:L-threonylcarbamoyladenylate synthase n=1 Tax=Variovorax sp. PCZ-1 TaxID=2835533 RepID=UPI001BCA6991|nr:L-threonylcarbamoyladenylate synthase [Variovorax sp. PCZ-1]MBS7806058.1 threonylcarbamoyl-AMP synthase [Variovorax sp. PCZ-1]
MSLEIMADLSVLDGAKRIAAGELLAFPTETVYGLGANAASDAAVAKIFAAKGRPADHPLIVHVSDAASALHFACAIPDFAQRLMTAFWPGPLTVIVPRKSGVASASAGGQDSIGLRCPAHPVARELLAECAKLGVMGVSAPSANKFGKVSPTTAAHVRAEFGDAVPVLDGGACDVGIESTIIDCTRGAPVLLRPGVLTPAQLEAAMGQALLSNNEHSAQDTRRQDAENTPKTTQKSDLQQPAPRASGTLASHYAPRAPLRLMDAKTLQTALDLLGSEGKNIAVYARAPLQAKSTHIILRRMPQDAMSTAQQLFAVLREFDAQNVRLIWVETVPEDAAWDGVRDRLQRAAA